MTGKNNFLLNLSAGIAFLTAISVAGQNNVIDSLKLLLKNAKHDTARCYFLSALAEAETDDAIWIKYSDEMKSIAEGNSGKCAANDPLKPVYLKYIARGWNNSGFLAQQNGEIKSALEYFSNSLKLQEQVGDHYGASTSLNNMAFIYFSQGDTAKALGHYERSYLFREKVGDKNLMANSLNNIGGIYHNKNEAVKALDYYSRSLTLYEEVGNKAGAAYASTNVASAHLTMGAYDRALIYYKRALQIQEVIHDKYGIAQTLANMGALMFRQKNYALAYEYQFRSYKIAQELGYPELVRNAARQLKQIFTVKGDYKKALEYYEVYITMRDSIKNETTKKASIKSQLKYEFEKKMATDSVAHAKENEIKKAQIAKQKVEINAKKSQQYVLFGGLGVVIVFAVFMYKRYRVTQKQKYIIELQKKVVEVKQKEILDSIYYARRIQQALITSEKYIARKLAALRNKNGTS